VIRCLNTSKIEGFTILEALIAGGLLLIGVFGISQIYFFTFFNTPKIENINRVNYILSKEAEMLLIKSYTTLDSYISSNYPKVISDVASTITVTCEGHNIFTWGRLLKLSATWEEGTENKTMTIELFKAKL